ncbi:hypothetical protein PVMG_05528 [Plasmodium vivax Mauritania I]|uniref:PIR Superfamily Protein n=1 Tax=Plasmodium vivax Mauritania I TaxID=1035515 RepID=A0A0J9TJI7_PLAVI|nr:hypothetical protein PVMG_05528 [Plasmodium vivax Mauritania I]
METSVGDEEYNLDEIFPTYKRDFDSVTENGIDQYKENCDKISKKFCPECEENFLAPCQKLIHYLKHIKKQSPVDIDIQSCKYFSYILKNELLNVKKTCDSTEECYKKLYNSYETKSDGIDVCKDYIKEINGKIFEKFQNLDSLYDNFYKFTKKKNEEDNRECHLGIECSEKYNEHIKLCHEASHIGFCKALDKFKNTYNNHMKDESKCENVPRYLNSPFGMDERSIFFTSLITIFAMSIKIFTVYKVSGILL